MRAWSPRGPRGTRHGMGVIHATSERSSPPAGQHIIGEQFHQSGHVALACSGDREPTPTDKEDLHATSSQPEQRRRRAGQSHTLGAARSGIRLRVTLCTRVGGQRHSEELAAAVALRSDRLRQP
jgi:hypothetical protein